MDEVKSRLYHEDGAVLGWHSGVRCKKRVGLWGRPASKISAAAEVRRSQGYSQQPQRKRKCSGGCILEGKAGFREGSVCMSAGTHSRPMHLGTAAFNGAVCTAA